MTPSVVPVRQSRRARAHTRRWPLVARGRSRLHGLGSFALEDIPAGTAISDYNDPRDLGFNWGSNGNETDTAEYNAAVLTDEFIGSLGRFTAEDLMLQPDTPPANLSTPTDADPYWRTKRDIRAGEELLV